MRSLIISAAALLLIMGVWGGFAIHTKNDIETVQYTIEEKMLPQAENEQWEEADANYVYIKEVWDSHHNFYLLFLDGSAITQIQQEMTRLESSLQGREPSGTVTSLKLLSEALDLLYKNELLTIENVF